MRTATATGRRRGRTTTIISNKNNKQSSSSNDYLAIASICAVCVIVIVAYGSYRCQKPSFKDPLTRVFAPAPFDKFLDGWGVAHLLFFTMLGYLYPRPHLLMFIFVLGVVWELIEYSIKDRPFYLSKCASAPIIDNRLDSGGTTTTTTTTPMPPLSNWWYGRWQDIVMNTIGMTTGATLAWIVSSLS